MACDMSLVVVAPGDGDAPEVNSAANSGKGATSRTRAAKGNEVSYPDAVSTSAPRPAAAATVQSSSAVLPDPGTPVTTTIAGRPSPASRRRWCRSVRSSVRPTNLRGAVAATPDPATHA